MTSMRNVVLTLLAALFLFFADADQLKSTRGLQMKPTSLRPSSSPLGSSSGSSASTSTSNSNSSNGVGKSDKQSMSPRGQPTKALTIFFNEVKDEALDIVEGFVYAESNDERIDHALDVLKRHRTTLGFAGGLWLVKNRLLSKAVAQKAATVRELGGLSEAAKWGKRKGAF